MEIKFLMEKHGQNLIINKSVSTHARTYNVHVNTDGYPPHSAS